MNPISLVPTVRPMTASDAQPYALLESAQAYFILLKLPGVDRSTIQVDLFENRRKLAVSTRRAHALRHQVDYWVFMVPQDGCMRAASMRFRGGVLEVVVPKERLVSKPEEPRIGVA